MNVLHMKYAVEVARCGSINKAAEELYIAQPNLSRCIKELEAELGITIFNRTFRGMTLTPEGEEFIGYAKKALEQIDDIERIFKNRETPQKQRFSISVPRASYISDAFARFSNCIDTRPAEINYMETNSSRAISNILDEDFHLGIIRYASVYDKYFKDYLDKKGLSYEPVSEFKYVLVMSADSPLASQKKINLGDLGKYIEIIHGDPYVPFLSLSAVKKEELADNVKRKIFLYERGGQFDLLCENTGTFMWVSPLPGPLLKRYGLVQRECEDNKKLYRDVMIRKKDYKLTELDKKFVAELKISKEKWLG